MQLDPSILDTVIAGALAVVGSYVATANTNKKKAQDDAIRDAEREQRQKDQLEVINKKLDEHNGYAKKFGEVEKSIAGLARDVEWIKEKIK